MGKKNKREVEKRRVKSHQIKTKKRQLKTAPQPRPVKRYRPGISEMGAPPGFRAISMSQAIMEYAKPLMGFAENGMCGLNDVLQPAMAMWNYATSVQRGEENKKIRKGIVDAFSVTFKLSKNEADKLCTEMVERYVYLFPEDTQPEDKLSPFMSIRKEMRTIIKPFDYSTLVVLDTVIPPDKEDEELISTIRKLDGYISEGVDYSEYEEMFLDMKDICEVRFHKWLTGKGLQEQQALSFSDCLFIYLDFIYGYMHDDLVLLKSVPPFYFQEFFEDYLIRKMLVEPNEYAYWPPAIKLFYRFLREKEYLDDPDDFVKKIDIIESRFIEVLRKQFT
jgi:hypothetical protein